MSGSRAKISIDAPELGKLLQGELQCLLRLSGDEHMDLKVAKLEPLLAKVAKQTPRLSKGLLQDAFRDHTKLSKQHTTMWAEVVLECWAHLMNKKKKKMRTGSGLSNSELTVIKEMLHHQEKSGSLSWADHVLLRLGSYDRVVVIVDSLASAS